MATAGPVWTFRPNGSAAAWTCRLAWAQAALAAIALAFNLAGIAIAVLPGIQTLLFIGSGIVSLRWLYVASANARAMGATDLMGGPAMAVIWYFVPFLNLGMPYIVMRDLWRASARPRDWQGQPSPPLVMLWWASWLILYLGLSAGIQLTLEYDPDIAAFGASLLTAASVGFIVCAMLFARIVGSVQALQDQTAPAQAFR